MPPLLGARTVQVGDALMCALSGDMTLDSEQVATQALNTALDRHPGVLAVGLAGVGFFTCTGLNALLATRRRATAEGVRLVLVAPPRQTLRVLEITDATALFTVCPSVEHALRSARPSTGRRS
ncbi:STAS domain-containing protein [Kitasatospora sp. NPDC092039]|uniref:STAS domain-containing protein n=1 Tax=Kitasatospora sp. NPDC092039 TaxID=3364086 RepID=UPI003805AEDD